MTRRNVTGATIGRNTTDLYVLEGSMYRDEQDSAMGRQDSTVREWDRYRSIVTERRTEPVIKTAIRLRKAPARRKPGTIASGPRR